MAKNACFCAQNFSSWHIENVRMRPYNMPLNHSVVSISIQVSANFVTRHVQTPRPSVSLSLSPFSPLSQAVHGGMTDLVLSCSCCKSRPMHCWLSPLALPLPLLWGCLPSG